MQSTTQPNSSGINTFPLTETDLRRVQDQAPEGALITNADERATHAAARLGVEAEEVERLPFDLSALESEGIFVNV